MGERGRKAQGEAPGGRDTPGRGREWWSDVVTAGR